MKKKQAQPPRVKTTIQLPPDFYRRLDKLAALQNRSRSNQIELIIADNLEGYEKAVGLQPQKK